MRLLLVEDDADFAEVVRYALERENHVVDHVDRIASARAAVRQNSYDLALLDRSLPDGDGLSLVPFFRETTPGLPVFMLTARSEIPDRVAGLDEGADDYLVKPFALQELFARIRAVQRRPAKADSELVQIGALVFDVINNEASVHGARLVLARRELSVLAALVKRFGRTVLRESLEQAVYGFDDAIQSNTLDSHISRLRRKLVAASAGVEIHAIKGVGYLLRTT